MVTQNTIPSNPHILYCCELRNSFSAQVFPNTDIFLLENSSCSQVSEKTCALDGFRSSRYTIKVMKVLLWFGTTTAILILTGILYLLFLKPSNDRNWSPDQKVLSYADIDGDTIKIRNIRNFNYRTTTDYDPSYYDKTFDLKKLKSVWYIVEPFSGYKGAAHTFLSFGFEGDEYVSISVEIRKQVGESFSAVKGLLRQYELMYVIADEKDVVKLRSNYRKDRVFIYPIKTTPDKMRTLFLDMLERTNKLKEKPEFYNTIWSTCTTNIVSHVNKIVPGRVPFRFDILLPANSDRLAHELGLIETNLTLDETRKKFEINERALKYADSPEFSKKIRDTENLAP